MKTRTWNHELRWGSILLFGLLFIAFFAPQMTKLDPHTLYEDMLSPPNSAYWLGTDGLGRDVYSMVLYGTRTSLKIGIIVAAISSCIGILIGALSGYIGGVVDQAISEVLNAFMMLPTFFLMLIVVAIYGSSIHHMIGVMALTSWVGTARFMRGQALALRKKGFVQSARAIGESHLRILFFHVIPNGIFPVISNAAMTVSSAILAEAGLSFLGLGDPNVISWGKIIDQGRAYLPGCWWICAAPGLAVVITAFTFYLLGEGLNRAINPQNR